MLNRRPRAHSAGWWLSLLHLISIFSVPQLIRAPRPLRPDVAFLPHLVYNSASNSNCNCLTSVLTELYNSSTSTQSPTRFLESHVGLSSSGITVMQFTGHSLPVHQSMSVPWEFFSSSYFISQFPPMRFPLITAIRMCHFLPVHHLGMAFLAGSKVKIQQKE